MATRRWPTRASASTQLHFRPQRRKSWRPRLRQQITSFFGASCVRWAWLWMNSRCSSWITRVPRR
eukprot:2572722-Prymnesium_polylepis.1